MRISKFCVIFVGFSQFIPISLQKWYILALYGLITVMI